MRIVTKNFSSPNHRITLENKNGYIAIHYMPFRKDMGVFWPEKSISEFGVNDTNYTEKLKKLLRRAEKAIGMELIKD